MGEEQKPRLVTNKERILIGRMKKKGYSNDEIARALGLSLSMLHPIEERKEGE